jgi:hypothetical protein
MGDAYRDLLHAVSVRENLVPVFVVWDLSLEPRGERHPLLQKINAPDPVQVV